MSPPAPSWSLLSPAPPRGGIAAFLIRASLPADLDRLLIDLGAQALPVGRTAVRHLPEIDHCVIARFDPNSLFLFPHAGDQNLRRVAAAMNLRGIARTELFSPRETYPEAQSEVEAQMLAALALAASPLAIDLLLSQPQKWRDADRAGHISAAAASPLFRLLFPPLVAAIGPPNVGKSSLLNTLAGRTLAIVADLPGTTRDHVGATLDLGGLCVRWLDCPGFNPADPDPLQVESQQIATTAAAAADLLIICGDSASGFPEPELIPQTPHQLRLALRADLGLPTGPHDLAVSVNPPSGLPALVTAIRDTLVPPHLLNDPRAWRFWDHSLAISPPI